MDVDGPVSNSDTVRIDPVHAGRFEFWQSAFTSF